MEPRTVRTDVRLSRRQIWHDQTLWIAFTQGHAGDGERSKVGAGISLSTILSPRMAEARRCWHIRVPGRGIWDKRVSWGTDRGCASDLPIAAARRGFA